MVTAQSLHSVNIAYAMSSIAMFFYNSASGTVSIVRRLLGNTVLAEFRTSVFCFIGKYGRPT